MQNNTKNPTPFEISEAVGRNLYQSYRTAYDSNNSLTFLFNKDLYGCYDVVVHNQEQSTREIVEIKKRNIKSKQYPDIYIEVAKVNNLYNILQKGHSDKRYTYSCTLAFLFEDGLVGEISINDVIKNCKTGKRWLNKTTAVNSGKVLKDVYLIPTSIINFKPTIKK